MEAGSRGVDCSGLWAMTGYQGLAVVLDKSLCLCVWRVYGQETREGPGQSSWPLAMKCWSQKMLEKGTWGRGGAQLLLHENLKEGQIKHYIFADKVDVSFS